MTASKNKTEPKIFSCVQMSRICFRLSNLKRTIFSYVFISLKHVVTILSSTTTSLSSSAPQFFSTKFTSTSASLLTQIYVERAHFLFLLRPVQPRGPSKQTAERAAEHKQEVSSLNLHLSLQAWIYRDEIYSLYVVG